MLCSIHHLSFTWPGSPDPVFTGLDLQLDTGWRLGLTGRNGRGKTTLLRLLQGLYPYEGKIDLPLPAAYFPFPVEDETLPTLQVMQAAAPGAPGWRLLREAQLLKIEESALERPFHSLSQGEQTKALLCALFCREDVYPLLDEPTNHLDLHGRELVADYLRGKDGFLLVSHDRAFLNRCVDHVLSLNREGAEVIRGDYDAWERQFDRQNASELAQNAVLQRDIARLNESARRAADWSRKAERGKFHVAESEAAAVDRGYVGARSAAMMKRSLGAVKRRERAAEEKSALLHNVERVGQLKLQVLRHPKQELVSVEEGTVRYGERVVCENLRFTVAQGQRIALTGGNGCGKSSVLKSLCGLSHALTGKLRLASGLVISYVPQSTEGLSGSLRAFIGQRGLDETLFKAILRNMDFSREQFERDLSRMSQGQKKKVLLAASLSAPAHLYVWDEPLNYIDVLSRRQIEELLLGSQPTLLLVEHDRVFLDRVCTGSYCLERPLE